MLAQLAVLTVLLAAALLLAGLTGLVATSKGHPFRLWAIVGGLLPVAGLAVVMIALRDRSTGLAGPGDEAVAATRRSVLARTLAGGGPGSREELVQRTGLAQRRVRLELAGLRELGMAAPSDGVWQLSADGAAALGDVTPADDPLAGAVGASAVAGALLASPASDRDVARRTGLGRRRARLQLTGLAGLDVVARDEDGRWCLTGAGRRLLAGEG